VLGVDEGNFHILTFTTSRWREITISKAMDQTRATIIGLDPETGYSAEEARELAALVHRANLFHYELQGRWR